MYIKYKLCSILTTRLFDIFFRRNKDESNN
jgi:hypothetical protein